jgi:hypothetical protein
MQVAPLAEPAALLASPIQLHGQESQQADASAPTDFASSFASLIALWEDPAQDPSLTSQHESNLAGTQLILPIAPPQAPNVPTPPPSATPNANSQVSLDANSNSKLSAGLDPARPATPLVMSQPADVLPLHAEAPGKMLPTAQSDDETMPLLDETSNDSPLAALQPAVLTEAPKANVAAAGKASLAQVPSPAAPPNILPTQPVTAASTRLAPSKADSTGVSTRAMRGAAPRTHVDGATGTTPTPDSSDAIQESATVLDYDLQLRYRPNSPASLAMEQMAEQLRTSQFPAEPRDPVYQKLMDQEPAEPVLDASPAAASLPNQADLAAGAIPKAQDPAPAEPLVASTPVTANSSPVSVEILPSPKPAPSAPSPQMELPPSPQPAPDQPVAKPRMRTAQFIEPSPPSPWQKQTQTISIRIPLDNGTGNSRHLDLVFRNTNNNLVLQMNTTGADIQSQIRESMPNLIEKLQTSDWHSVNGNGIAPSQAAGQTQAALDTRSLEARAFPEPGTLSAPHSVTAGQPLGNASAGSFAGNSGENLGDRHPQGQSGGGQQGQQHNDRRRQQQWQAEFNNGFDDQPLNSI